MTDYYAQELSPKQRQDFLFYGVQENISSIDSCAKFCYETEFCRTAVYDIPRKRCELAYASVIRCNTVFKNKSSYRWQSNQIIAIYCIDCPTGIVNIFLFNHCNSVAQFTVSVESVQKK